MDFTEIKVSVGTAALETAEAICQMVSDCGIYTEDYSDLEEMSRVIAHSDLIEQELLERDTSTAVIHIYLSAETDAVSKLSRLSELLAAAGIGYSIASAEVSDSDWADNWKKYFRPFDVGDRLAVCPSWEEYHGAAGRRILHIDPGAAFGSGTHETTRLCLETLEKYMSPGKTVLDIGCGSGILSIASLLLGADSAVGVDIDAGAVKTARENALINGFEEPQYTVFQGDLANSVQGRYDIITANIIADAIIRLLPDIHKYMKDGACALLSGIISERSGEVQRCIAENGFKIAEMTDKNGWACITVVRSYQPGQRTPGIFTEEV